MSPSPNPVTNPKTTTSMRTVRMLCPLHRQASPMPEMLILPTWEQPEKSGCGGHLLAIADLNP
jgi:hypothetical protein